MARGKDQGPKQGGGGVVRRAPADRKRLPADLEAFAAGDDDALWRRPRQGGRLRDPRPATAALVPGVANRDARAVADARVKRMRQLLEGGDRDALAIELAEAVRLALWRGLKVVAFDPFAEAVIGMPPLEARELAHRGAAVAGFACKPGGEQDIAIWMRAEAGLLEAGVEGAAARLRGERLVLEVPLAGAASSLAAMGRRAAPMARDPEGPDTVVDRPKGVEPLARIIARDRPRE